MRAMNGTNGPHGMVPLLLPFWTLNAFLEPITYNIIQMERFKALKCPRTEMKTIDAQKRIRQAKQSNSPDRIQVSSTPRVQHTSVPLNAKR